MVAVLVLSPLCLSPLYGQTTPRQPGSQSARPSEPPPPVVTLPSPERTLALSLKEAIQLALEHNLAIRRERFSPPIAHTEVLKARAAFDPVVGVDTQVSATKNLPTDRTVLFDAAGNIIGEQIIQPSSQRQEFTPRLRQKIPLGGNYELRFINFREQVSPSQFGATSRIADPRFESQLELAFTQPLLRDFGITVNTAAIRQAEKSELMAAQQVLQAILDTLFAVQRTYWELIFRIQDLEVKRESQRLAEQFLAENRLRVELGLLPPVELVQAETRVKTRQSAVIRAAAVVGEAADQLKDILNLREVVGTWKISLRPTDQLLFVPTTVMSVEDHVAMALKNRPDFVRSQLDIAVREIGRDVARNQRLPRLDIVSCAGVQAFGEGLDESTGRLRKAEGYAWSIGLRLEQPLGNRVAQHELLKRELELQQALVGQQQLLLTMVREIAQALRDIETLSEQVEVTRAARALAHTQLEAEREKFRLGLTNSLNVLQLQEELSAAHTAEIRVLSDYNVALASLDQVTGTLQHADLSPNSTQK